MALNDAELATLKTELDTDPMTLGYTTDDPLCAELLNEVRSGGDYQMPNTSVSSIEVKDAIDASELPAVDVNGLQFFLSRVPVGGNVNISSGSPIIGQVAQIFTAGAAPNSRAVLARRGNDGTYPHNN